MCISGGASALPMAEAAENDPNNTVGQVITVGGSLTGGDIFNFTSENTANSTALRFYGENLDIPMTGSGVYTINGNGGIISHSLFASKSSCRAIVKMADFPIPLCPTNIRNGRFAVTLSCVLFLI